MSKIRIGYKFSERYETIKERIVWGSSIVGGLYRSPPHPPGSTTDEEKDYQDMICLGRKGGRFSQGEKGPKPLSPGAFIRFIRIGIG